MRYMSFHHRRYIVPLALLLQPTVAAPVAAKTIERHVTATEVTVRGKSPEAEWLRERLVGASSREAAYYDPGLPSATMRITIQKLKVKSAGKALASSLPVVGMFAGTNENRLKGEIRIVDPVSQRVLARHKIDCDDYTNFSAADGLFTYAQLGVSFLPFGDLIASAAEIGRSAGTRKVPAQEKLVAGFIMLSYKKLYGNKRYKSFAEQRKADFAAVAMPVASVPAAPEAAAPAAPPATAPASVIRPLPDASSTPSPATSTVETSVVPPVLRPSVVTAFLIGPGTGERLSR